MNERTCPFSSKLEEIPENVIFVGCCNPYRLDMTKEGSDGDDDVAVKHQQLGFKKSHKVYPVCDSLLGYIYDFGILRKEVEKAYIKAIV